MFLMRADTLRGEVGGGGGFALEIGSFLGPFEIRPQKLEIKVNLHLPHVGGGYMSKSSLNNVKHSFPLILL
jgi:hypothetical protein